MASSRFVREPLATFLATSRSSGVGATRGSPVLRKDRLHGRLLVVSLTEANPILVGDSSTRSSIEAIDSRSHSTVHSTHRTCRARRARGPRRHDHLAHRHRPAARGVAASAHAGDSGRDLPVLLRLGVSKEHSSRIQHRTRCSRCETHLTRQCARFTTGTS